MTKPNDRDWGIERDPEIDAATARDFAAIRVAELAVDLTATVSCVRSVPNAPADVEADQ